MEILNFIISLISNVGFPIAMCCFLVWYINNTMKTTNATMASLQQTVENNTAVVAKLNDRIDKMENKIL